MAKKKKDLVKLVSTANTGYFVVRHRISRYGAPKLALMKYDPRVRKRVEFKEKPLK